MNKDLVKKCNSIINNLVKDNTLDYNLFITELNKNHHYRSDLQHSNAIKYMRRKSIIFMENGLLSIHNFNKKDQIKINSCLKNNKTTDKPLMQEYIQQHSIKKEDYDDEEEIFEEFDVNELKNDEDYTYLDNDKEVYFNTNDLSQYMQLISQFEVLDQKTETELFRKYKATNDPKLKEYLINHNLKLVVSIAKRYISSDMPLLDIIQYGNLGLIKGVEKFDPEVGTKLSTYATWWIRQAILRGLSMDNRLIRMPCHATDQAYKNRKARKELDEKLGRKCTDEELLDYINENHLLNGSIQKLDMNNLKLYDKFYTNNIVSLNMPISTDGEKDEAVLGDFIPSDQLTPEEQFINDDLKNLLIDVINKTIKRDRDREVIYLRFGLNDDLRHYTLDEIALKMKVSRERIRQMETRSIRILRNSKYARTKLKDYYDNRHLSCILRGQKSCIN